MCGKKGCKHKGIKKALGKYSHKDVPMPNKWNGTGKRMAKYFSKKAKELE